VEELSVDLALLTTGTGTVSPVLGQETAQDPMVLSQKLGGFAVRHGRSPPRGRQMQRRCHPQQLKQVS